MNIWAVKFGSNTLPTKRNMALRGHREDNEYPSCGSPNEDADHIFRCQDGEIEKVFQDGMDAIRDFSKPQRALQFKMPFYTSFLHSQTIRT